MKLPPKLRQINAVLGRFVRPDEDHRNIPSVTSLQHRILIHVDFAKNRTELAQDWGGTGFEANTAAELRSALEAAHRCKTFAIIDAHVGRDDLSPVTIKYIKAAAKRSQAPLQHKTNHHGLRP